MSSINVVVESEVKKTAALAKVEGMFDLDKHEPLKKEWHIEADMPDEWSIGLVVGPSGAGKSQVANQIWPKNIVRGFEWPKDKCVIDGFSADVKEVTATLNAVGFSSPPSWRKPFHVLSNGEKFRCELARAILESPSPVVFDEFTSVVDRTVAKIGSKAVAKAVRRQGKQFIAVSCHDDVIEWLQPDWVIQPHLQSFERRSLQPTPKIELTVEQVGRESWQMFREHHYLSHTLHSAAKCWCAFWGDLPVAFSSWVHFPHPKAKNAFREHRTVVLPDYQGVGIGNRLSEFMASHYKQQGKTVYSTTSAPSMIKHRAKSKNWTMIRKPGHVQGSRTGALFNRGRGSASRITASFRYVGD